eukprot:sb/3469722/
MFTSQSNSLFRPSCDWLSANRGIVFPDSRSVGSCRNHDSEYITISNDVVVTAHVHTVHVTLTTSSWSIFMAKANQPMTSLLISNSVVSNYIWMCHHRATLPIQPAAKDPMIWTFYKTDDTFSIECNGVMLVTYTFDSCKITNSNWKGDTIGKIAFSPTHDTASNFYREYEPAPHEPTDTSKQPIRTRYLGHVTGYQPIRDQYFQNVHFVIYDVWRLSQSCVT